MPNIHEIRTTFQGFSGAPGYNQLYFDAAGTPQDSADAVGTFWNAIASRFPSGWTFSIDGEVKEFVDSTGALVGVTSITPPTQSIFGTPGSYAGGAGACISWGTAAVHSGRPLRGRTFVVPLMGENYDSSGTLASATLTTLNDAAAYLVSFTGNFGVWGRPVAGANGLWAQTTSRSVRDHVAFLSSRRD